MPVSSLCACELHSYFSVNTGIYIILKLVEIGTSLILYSSFFIATVTGTAVCYVIIKVHCCSQLRCLHVAHNIYSCDCEVEKTCNILYYYRSSYLFQRIFFF